MNLNVLPNGCKPQNDFDPSAGSLVERVIFSRRLLVLLLCGLLTLFFASQLRHLQLSASFEKMIPQGHEYIRNFTDHQNDLVGLGNAVRIALANPQGSIYDQRYMETLRELHDEIFLLPGVNRMQLKSLWSPSTRWAGVTVEGLEGGPVIPEAYDGSAQSLQQLAANLARSGEIGRLVATDFGSTVLFVPLLATDAEGRAVDYAALAETLEQMREKYEARGYSMHITGFAKLVGDLIDGVRSVLLFFAISICLGAAVLYWFTRCWRSTAVVVTVSLVAVVWQLGVLPTMGYALDPYSILVPFLVFAIGMSHGSQLMNGTLQSIGRGVDKQMAAQQTFRRLFRPGLAALVTDTVGFAVLLVIDIQAIRELALAASIGVGILIFTNLILLPLVLSYLGVCPRAAQRSLRAEQAEQQGTLRHPLWRLLDRFTSRAWAAGAIGCALFLAAGGLLVSKQIQIGDLDPGAPELRQDSRYNLDVAFLNANYGASSDVLAVMVKTPQGYCSAATTLNKVDALEWQLRQLDGVESTETLALLSRRMSAALNEGNPKWYDFVPNQSMLNAITASAPRGLYDDSCSLLTLYVFLTDHKAATLARVTEHVERFAMANDDDQVQFLLAAGTAGIEAATNSVVGDAWRQMTYLVYAIVALLTLIAFRSWRVVVVALLPLMLTSILAEALMVGLGMGVKVATLPVIALGVGIGVDYALYILSVLLTQLKAGQPLSLAYYRSLIFTGKVVMLTGITLSVGVATWLASPIKFQADMGALLAFMFLWNMLGALVLVPALAAFLLQPRGVAAKQQPCARLDVDVTLLEKASR
ncbi:RND family transporter [Pseudomonas lalucatii]|uniref:RND family transporter n=1 Tax=Pseudomonas lalucatii TaxID=1424203 RepID=A0ABS5Q4C1_9PSED|nr:MMPL family transporter [Pseudomonas lalucatii]MBS7663625.1 RND family transporter [Pseudomonas lalucatii]MBS7725123.1 RND family transporter [Pseudomonas lalucatii]QVM86908.1 RND family transporter [Pseudomonas lalucatii]